MTDAKEHRAEKRLLQSFLNFGESNTPEPCMKCVVVLTEAEEQTLQQLSINHPHQDMRTRAAALLMLALVHGCRSDIENNTITVAVLTKPMNLLDPALEAWLR
ncbi:hypothetical protein [Burkholderia territorii]|uniref:hypothetical protein n=1 Tax=Burkholderia territorii TaxID=1503055 RepID=UPI000A67C912|nr:hypothetical protein [Burkholderia territorii]